MGGGKWGAGTAVALGSGLGDSSVLVEGVSSFFSSPSEDIVTLLVMLAWF